MFVHIHNAHKKIAAYEVGVKSATMKGQVKTSDICKDSIKVYVYKSFEDIQNKKLYPVNHVLKGYFLRLKALGIFDYEEYSVKPVSCSFKNKHVLCFVRRCQGTRQTFWSSFTYARALLRTRGVARGQFSARPGP